MAKESEKTRQRMIVDIVMGNKRVCGGKFSRWGSTWYYVTLIWGKNYYKQWTSESLHRYEIPENLEGQFKRTPRYNTTLKPIVDEFRAKWAEATRLCLEGRGDNP